MKRWVILTIFLLVLLGVHLSGLSEYLSFDAIKTNREWLTQYVEESPYLSSLLFILFYTTIVSLSIPGATFVTLSGGFLFTQPISTLLVLCGATLGASIIFLIAKTTLGDYFHEKAGSNLKKMEKGFNDGAVSYLLFLRLVPLFPFWLVNVAPALFQVPFKTFVWTTFVGIIPGVFVYTQAGAGLGAIFESGDSFTLANLLNTEMKIALVALGVLALLPIVIKKWTHDR